MAGAFWYYQRASEGREGRSPHRQAAVQPRYIARDNGFTAVGRGVAVRESEPTRTDDAFFVDGIHDDILTQLSKISGLKVISRTSVEPFFVPQA